MRSETQIREALRSWVLAKGTPDHGPLTLADQCDRAFASLAAIWDASEERHPATLPAVRLQRVDHLRSFPHQASLAARLSPAALTEFLSGGIVGEHGQVRRLWSFTMREIVCVGTKQETAAFLHHDHFGTAFGITRGGAPAHSACLAFGIERWLCAFRRRQLVRPVYCDQESFNDLVAAASQFHGRGPIQESLACAQDVA